MRSLRGETNDCWQKVRDKQLRLCKGRKWTVFRLNPKVIVTKKDLFNGSPTKLLTEGFIQWRSDTVFWKSFAAAKCDSAVQSLLCLACRLVAFCQKGRISAYPATLPNVNIS